MKKWRINNSEYLLHEPWIVVRKDNVITDKGVEIPDYYVLECPTWVNIIAITTQGLLLIEEQYRHGIQKVCFEVPAGACNNNEEPLEAAKRELLEETGYASDEWTLFDTVAPNPSNMNNYCYTFIANNVQKTQKPTPEVTESIKLHLCTLQDVVQLMEEGLIIESSLIAPLRKYLLRALTDSKNI